MGLMENGHVVDEAGSLGGKDFLFMRYEDPISGHEVSVSKRVSNIDEVLEAVEMLLRGSGYVLEYGSLRVVQEGEE